MNILREFYKNNEQSNYRNDREEFKYRKIKFVNFLLILKSR